MNDCLYGSCPVPLKSDIQLIQAREDLWIQRIYDKQQELYRAKYGRRSEDTLSTLEIEAIRHEAAVAVNKERKERATDTQKSL